MLEMLKKSDGSRPARCRPPPRRRAAADCVPEWAISEADAFIEVGGPNKAVEAPADVMAVTHPAQPKQPPHPPLGKALAQSSILALTQATPLVVAFEPWTGLTAGSTGLTRTSSPTTSRATKSASSTRNSGLP